MSDRFCCDNPDCDCAGLLIEAEKLKNSPVPSRPSADLTAHEFWFKFRVGPGENTGQNTCVSMLDLGRHSGIVHAIEFSAYHTYYSLSIDFSRKIYQLEVDKKINGVILSALKRKFSGLCEALRQISDLNNQGPYEAIRAPRIAREALKIHGDGE